MAANEIGGWWSSRTQRAVVLIWMKWSSHEVWGPGERVDTEGLGKGVKDEGFVDVDVVAIIRGAGISIEAVGGV